MDKVLELRKAGLSHADAVKQALAQIPVPGTPTGNERKHKTLAWVAEYHGIWREQLSNVINGIKKPSDSILTALVAELGGTATQWRAFLAEAEANR
jgi:hypothetical protein